MLIETNRLIITKLNIDMAEDIHLNSLDQDNRRFVPDEVFETIEDAEQAIEYLIGQYDNGGPYVYPILKKDTKENIGYVQMIPLDNEWEIGYHIGMKYTKNGYAKEAVTAFLPIITKKLGIKEVIGICLSENMASKHVLNKCGFVKVFEGLGNYQGEKREIFKSVWINK